MSAPDSKLHLLYIRDCCQRIAECVGLRTDGTVPERILLDAVCRNLEILGEAARKVVPEFRVAHSEIPWREMNDLRNVLIHNYEGADPGIVWGVAVKDIPKLLESVLRLIE